MAKRKGKVDLIEKTLDEEIETPVIETVELSSNQNESSGSHSAEDVEVSARTAAKKPRSFKLQFFGREYVEGRFPKSLHWADQFAQEWVNEGDFDFIKLSNPRAQEAVLLGLKNIRAVEKNIEKKVEEAFTEYSVKLAPYSEKLAPYAKMATEKVEQIVSKLRQ